MQLQFSNAVPHQGRPGIEGGISRYYHKVRLCETRIAVSSIATKVFLTHSLELSLAQRFKEYLSAWFRRAIVLVFDSRSLFDRSYDQDVAPQIYDRLGITLLEIP